MVTIIHLPEAPNPKVGPPTLQQPRTYIPGQMSTRTNVPPDKCSPGQMFPRTKMPGHVLPRHVFPGQVGMHLANTDMMLQCSYSSVCANFFLWLSSLGWSNIYG